MAMPLAQIANFDMRILEHVVVSDEDRQETRLRLAIRRRGQERTIEMTAAEFASNGRLRTVVYGSALPGADLKAGADVLRRAVIALSDPTIRRVTTATGWTADRTRFLVPGGFVDAGGYHDDDPALDIPQVDLSDCDNAQWLGLRRLDRRAAPRGQAARRRRPAPAPRAGRDAGAAGGRGPGGAPQLRRAPVAAGASGSSA